MPVTPTAKSFFFKLHTNTLPVKTWLQEKGIFVPWTTDCILCHKPENIEHAFLDCWDAVFYWDVLQRTLKKELPLYPYGIRFVPIESPYDMIMILGFHGLWKTRMQVRHADVHVKSSIDNFIESVVQIKEMFRAQPDPPDWVTILDALSDMKKF
uniref:Reverse transcriptase zinc-binding domain-containing protein n=1 Tax=Rhipicephalus pulchellus TaxID=72859 RepID=L7M607_RHIPC